MPQFKCTACGAGLYSAAATADLTDPHCPTCGSHPHRVRQPERIARRRTAPGGHIETTRTHNRGHQRIVDRFASFMARGRPDEVTRIDADRWLDDDGGFSSAAVAGVRRPPTGSRA